MYFVNGPLATLQEPAEYMGDMTLPRYHIVVNNEYDLNRDQWRCMLLSLN
jgi:hypothetical protein